MSPGPQEVRMEQPDDQQPSHPAVVRPPGVAARLGPPRHQDDARTEEHREDRHELLVGEHPAGHPDVEVRPFEVAVGGRVEVRRLGHRERLDVHEEDAEQRDAAQDVDGVDARGPGHGPGVRTVRGSGHAALTVAAAGFAPARGRLAGRAADRRSGVLRPGSGIVSGRRARGSWGCARRLTSGGVVRAPPLSSLPADGRVGGVSETPCLSRPGRSESDRPHLVTVAARSGLAAPSSLAAS